MSNICVTAHANAFAACVTGIDLTQPVTGVLSDQLRAQWLRYQVLYFPDQPMTHGDLERFTESLGPFGHDPYISPVPGHPNILEVRHEPDEAAIPFGSSYPIFRFKSYVTCILMPADKASLLWLFDKQRSTTD